MTERRTGRLMRGPWHIHPATIAVASGSLCLLLSLFPPRLYSELIEERNYMFGSSLLWAYVVLCTAAFALGTFLLAGGPHRRTWRAATPPRTAGRKVPPWLPPVLALVASVIGIGTTIEFIGNPALFLAALATGSAESLRGDAVEQAVDSGISVLSLLPIGFPLLQWAIFQTFCQPRRTGRVARRIVSAGAFVYPLCLTLTLQRNLLIPYLLCVFVMLSGTKWHSSGLRVGQTLKFVLVGVGTIVLLFVAVAYFRGGDSQSPFTVLVGYLAASINRLAALVQGVLHPAISGEPYYSFRFVWHPPLIRRFLPIDEFGRQLGLTIPQTVIDGWVDEFQAIADADLNPMYIWATTFGYAFYDFGWWSVFYFLLFGMAAGWTWNRFKARSAYGIIFLPYFVTAILLWPTDNFMALPQIWLFVAAAAMLSFFDRRPLRRSRGVPIPELPADPMKIPASST